MRSLHCLFDPRSVALVGASATPGKWGNILAQTVIGGRRRRAVYFVNRRGGEILGQPAYASPSDLPDAPELVLIVVPESGFEEAVDASLAAGARAIIAIVAGLGEVNEKNRRREAEIVGRVRAAGAVMLGPNCMGVIDTATELSAAAHLTLPPGDVALVTQSGGLGLELGLRAKQAGVGFSRFVSLGNQADLAAADLLRDLADHEPSRVIAMYVEDMRDGRDLARAALEVRARDKHVVLLAPGRSEATARAARSHTGSLAGDSEAIDALCGASGITRVKSSGELFETAIALIRPRVPRGRRVALISDGGGAAMVGAELCGEAGFTVPPFSDKLQAALAEGAHALATVTNPMDLLADDPAAIARSVELIAASGEVDAAVFSGVFGYTASKQYPPELGDLSELEAAEVAAAASIGRTVEESGFPVVASTIATPTPVIEELARFGVPMYRDVTSAVRVLSKLAEAGRTPRGVPSLPQPATPIASNGYEAARGLLAAAGVPFPEARFVSGVEEALAAANEIGFPVVAKALGMLHKSDAGGVALDLRTPDELRAALARMHESLRPERLSIERMAPEGVELIVGARWDAQIGPLLLIGLGGVFAEILRDVRTALAPAAPDTVIEMVESLRGAELLRGARGRAPVDLRAVGEVAAIISWVAAEHPDIAEMEVNPLLASASGAIALDARVVPAAPVQDLEGVA